MWRAIVGEDMMENKHHLAVDVLRMQVKHDVKTTCRQIPLNEVHVKHEECVDRLGEEMSGQWEVARMNVSRLKIR